MSVRARNVIAQAHLEQCYLDLQTKPKQWIFNRAGF